MQNSDTQNETRAKTRVVLALLGAGLLLVALFFAVLSYSLTHVKTIAPEGYSAEKPDGFVCELELLSENGTLLVQGWAVVEGGRFYGVDTRVVLASPDGNTWLQIPTAMVEREELSERYADNPLNYLYGGFEGYVKEKKLAQSGVWDVYLLFLWRGEDLLLPTGTSWEVA